MASTTTDRTVEVNLDDLNLTLGLLMALRMNFAIKVEQVNAYKRINAAAIEATNQEAS